MNDRWLVPEADEARRAIWQMLNPRWHFTPPRYAADGKWHARSGSYSVESATLGSLMDKIVSGDTLDGLPDEMPVSSPDRAGPGFWLSHVHHDPHL